MILFVGLPVGAADKENCLMCHKYRQLGRIDEDGKKRNYNVDENLYANTTHRNVPCRDCHTYIKKLPHEPVTEEVSCATECHIKPPFAKENFSHKKIIATYNDSVHGIKKDDSPEVKKAKPYCKFCHLNPQYREVAEERIDPKALLRCLNCHEKKGVTMAYKHITHRLRRKTSRSPQEIVELCSKCHGDTALMAGLKVSKESLDGVKTYEKSIHGQAIALGSDKTADCISCHATSAIHDIYKKDDKRSTTHKFNLVDTCKQCHEKVTAGFIQIDVHSNFEDKEKSPILYFMSVGLGFVLYGTLLGFLSLMLIETYGRKKDGIKWMLKRGTTWRGRSTRRPKK